MIMSIIIEKVRNYNHNNINYMKKLISVLSAMLICNICFAQEVVTIKAGTVIPMQAVRTVKAADVEVGQAVDFLVSEDIVVKGVTVIPKGTPVKGTVSEAKKSTIAGTKGRLVVNISRMNLPNGDPIFFSNTVVNISGNNRTPLAVVTALFVWPCIFIPGTKAVMPEGYEVMGMVASNVNVTVE